VTMSEGLFRIPPDGSHKKINKNQYKISHKGNRKNQETAPGQTQIIIETGRPKRIPDIG